MSLAGGEMWDERYSGADYAYGRAPNGYLAAQTASTQAGLRALVPGDGEGRNGVFLAERGFTVDTLDLSAEGVAKSQALARERGVSVNAVQADALAWNWPQATYDLIALIYFHLLEADRRTIHARALQALRPGGRLVLEAFRPEQVRRREAGARGGPRDLALLYTVEALAADFAGADILELYEADVDLAEGRLHSGRGAVVRALVRRRQTPP